MDPSKLYPVSGLPPNFIQDNELQPLQSQSYSKQLQESILLQMMSPSILDDFLLLSIFSGKGLVYFGGHLAGKAVPTSTFVPLYKEPQDPKNLSTLVPGCQSGIQNGITFLLDAETFDFTYNLQHNEGFTLGIKHHLDYETIEFDTSDIQPGETTTIAVQSELVSTEPVIRNRFDAEDTKCYFDGEVILDHFPANKYRYSMKNCLFEAFLQETETKCNNTNKVRNCRFLNQISLGKHFDVVSNGKKMKCYARCIDQTFTSSLSTSKYPNLNAFPYYGYDFCMVMQKIVKSCGTIKKDALEEKYQGICSHFINLNPDLKAYNCPVWNFENVKVRFNSR